MSRNTLKKLIAKESRRAPRGYPVATIAFYGPNATLATKVVVAIFSKESNDPDLLKKWFSTDEDIRSVPEVGDEVKHLLKENRIKTVAAADRIIGCPHEEGIDYPEGAPCPKCPFWAHRDRFTHDLIQ